MLSILLVATLAQSKVSDPPSRPATIVPPAATAPALDAGAIADLISQRVSVEIVRQLDARDAKAQADLDRRLDAYVASTQAALIRMAQSVEQLAQAQAVAVQRASVATPPTTRPASAPRTRFASTTEAKQAGKFYAYDANGKGWWGDTQQEVDAYAASVPLKPKVYSMPAAEVVVPSGLSAPMSYSMPMVSSPMLGASATACGPGGCAPSGLGLFGGWR